VRRMTCPCSGPPRETLARRHGAHSRTDRSARSPTPAARQGLIVGARRTRRQPLSCLSVVTRASLFRCRADAVRFGLYSPLSTAYNALRDRKPPMARRRAIGIWG
jgi:hypothetical protein